MQLHSHKILAFRRSYKHLYNITRLLKASPARPQEFLQYRFWKTVFPAILCWIILLSYIKIPETIDLLWFINCISKYGFLHIWIFLSRMLKYKSDSLWTAVLQALQDTAYPYLLLFSWTSFGKLSPTAYISSFYLPREVRDRTLRAPPGSAAVPHRGFNHLCFRLALICCSCGTLGLTSGQESWEERASPHLLGALWKFERSAGLVGLRWDYTHQGRAGAHWAVGIV